MTLSRQMNECPVFPTSPEAWHQTAGCGRLLQTEAVFLFHTEHGKALGTGVFSLCSASNQRWVTGQVTEPSLSSSFTCEHNELISFQGLKAAVLKLHLASDTCHTYQVPHHTSSAWLATSPGPVHWTRDISRTSPLEGSSWDHAVLIPLQCPKWKTSRAASCHAASHLCNRLSPAKSPRDFCSSLTWWGSLSQSTHHMLGACFNSQCFQGWVVMTLEPTFHP